MCDFLTVRFSTTVKRLLARNLSCVVRTTARRTFVVWCGVMALLASPASAIQITGYNAVVNDVFSSGFPLAPVPNIDPQFLGLGYDWTGVGWDQTNPTKAFGFISPVHYLVARHYGGAATIDTWKEGGVDSLAQASVENTDYGVVFQDQVLGDLSLGTLTSPLSAALPRYAVLDLNVSSAVNSPSLYQNQPLFLFGRGPHGGFSPRIGGTSLVGVILSGQNAYFLTGRSQIRLESGDSGSPAFIPWANPNGGKELTIIGNNAAINDDYNFLNFLGSHQVMTALNNLMVDDGYALRVVGNPSATWTGSGAGLINNRSSWGLSAPASAPSDVFVQFNAGTAVNRTVSVNANHNLRGLYFLGGPGTGAAFQFTNSNVLTIGRGGLTNYASVRQVFTAPLRLGDHQYWDIGPAGVSVNALDTNGKLLEISGSGTATFSGAMTGAGGLAVNGVRVEMTGSSSYTGKTWVHLGTLLVDGDISSSQEIILGAGGSVGGSGRVAKISGGGVVEPGGGIGILTTPQILPGGGMDFRFEFSVVGALLSHNPTASGNDVLRLTGEMPFSEAFTSLNEIAFFLNVPELALNNIFQGGFFTDAPASFFSSIENASFVFYLANPEGAFAYGGAFYDLYTGPLAFELTTVAASADFGTGVVDGRILQITVKEFAPIPEPRTWMLLGIAVVVWGLLRRRQEV